MEHTKGNWETSKLASPDYAPQYGAYAKGERNAFCIVTGENAESDARLIAAAPDLLAACKGILIYAHEIEERVDIDDGHAFWAYIADAADAIAAATGN